jgi:hypothetical protein
VTVLPPPTEPMPAISVRPAEGKHDIHISHKQGKIYALELTWNAVSDADYYRVYRDGDMVCETAVAMLPDSPDKPEASYRVEAVRDGKVIGQAETGKILVPIIEIKEQPAVKANVMFTGITLTWPPAKSEAIASYRISRGPAEDPVNQRVLGTTKASNHFEHKFSDAAPTGNWIYKVTALNTADQPATATEVKVDFVRQVGSPPVLDAPLTSKPDGANVVGSVTFGNSGAFFEGGYITIPHDNHWNLGHGLTLAFEFKADSMSGMPVILSHGQWQGDGWFMQIMNNRMVMRTLSGDLTGPEMEIGKWYSALYRFDGNKCSLVIDGSKVAEVPMEDTPTTKDLVIGQYEKKEPTYAFHGTIRNLKIWDEAITESGD